MTKNKEYLDNLRIHNARLRVKFEKEAHDREREDIMVVVDVYNKWINNNSIRQSTIL